VVDDGEGIAVDAVAHLELALEVDGPDLVRASGPQGRGPRMFPRPAAPAMLDVAVAGEDVPDRAASGPGAVGSRVRRRLRILRAPQPQRRYSSRISAMMSEGV
jgi:hypothetical protein